MKKYLIGFLGGLAIAVVIGLLVCWSGVVNVSALGGPGMMDPLLQYSSARSIAHHAPAVTNPLANEPDALTVGLAHYKENCLACHGAPGVERAEFAQGLNPRPPDLRDRATLSASDGELFWVVSNGIGMTGMPAFSPTHDEQEIWKIIAFVRHLPVLTAAEREQLNAGRESEESHHHAEDHH